MKKISILIMIVGLVGLFACSKYDKTTLKATPDAPVLTLPAGGATIVLDKANKDVPVKYTWTAAEYGAQLVVTYNVQMDKQGNNFADPVSLGTIISKDTLALTTEELNNKLLVMLPDPSTPQPLDLEFRVTAKVNDSVDIIISASAAQTITPYYVPVVYPLLQVPGSYQGWNPADSSTSIASVKANSMYEGYLYFNIDNAEFKYTVGPTWDLNYGDDGADGTLQTNGANIIAGAAGYYKLNVDLVNLTHTFLLTTWGVIGDATPGGWDTDTDMTYDETTKVWTVTLDLTAASIKFRANHAWDVNYGDDGANGTLEAGGANIAITEAGNYTVILNLSKPIYKYTLVKN
jgi:starch-binding outer membrane protein SusE/F